MQKEVAEGTTDVADLLMETGGGTAEGLDSKAEDLKDVEISDEVRASSSLLARPKYVCQTFSVLKSSLHSIRQHHNVNAFWLL